MALADVTKLFSEVRSPQPSLLKNKPKPPTMKRQRKVMFNDSLSNENGTLESIRDENFDVNLQTKNSGSDQASVASKKEKIVIAEKHNSKLLTKTTSGISLPNDSASNQAKRKLDNKKKETEVSTVQESNYKLVVSDKRNLPSLSLKYTDNAFKLNSGFSSIFKESPNIYDFKLSPTMKPCPKVHVKRIDTPKSIRKKVRLLEFRKKQSRKAKRPKKDSGKNTFSTLTRMNRVLFKDENENRSLMEKIQKNDSYLTARNILFWIFLISVFLAALVNPQAIRKNLLHFKASFFRETYSYLDTKESIDSFQRPEIERQTNFGTLEKVAESRHQSLPNTKHDEDSRSESNTVPSIKILHPSMDGLKINQGDIRLKILVENVFPTRYVVHKDPRVCLSITSEITSVTAVVGCFETKIGISSDVTLRNIKPDKLNIHATLISKVKKLARANRRVVISDYSVSPQDVKGTLDSLSSAQAAMEPINPYSDTEELCETTCTRTCTTRTLV